MARRKRTRKELEEARRENESVNATPAAPEERTAKRRRQAHRSNKRCNITKALEAMSVAEGDADTAALTEAATTIPPIQPFTAADHPFATASVVLATTTDPDDVAQERRRRDAERQRRRRAEISASQHERERAKNAERARARRARLFPLAQNRVRAADAERHRVERARALETNTSEVRERERLRRAELRSTMTDAQQEASQDSARIRQQVVRANQSAEEAAIDREIHRVRVQDAREYRTSGEEATDREIDRNRHQHTRGTRTEEEVAAARERDRLRTQEMRANRTAEEQAADRERARKRRRCLQKGLALCNQKDFSASMVTGPHIVDGRHRLPPTTVCEHCNASKWPAESKKGCCIEGAVQLPPLAAAPLLLRNLLKDKAFRRQIRAYNQAFAFTSIGTSCNARGTFGPVNQDESVAGQRGVYTYRIQGAMGHYLGSLLPYVDPRTQLPTDPKFAQIYIVDPDMDSARFVVVTFSAGWIP